MHESQRTDLSVCPSICRASIAQTAIVLCNLIKTGGGGADLGEPAKDFFHCGEPVFLLGALYRLSRFSLLKD